MNFSDKLIKLRKQKLLSQEELGEKLNVTRQTVSKWELGQTTPDMEKLLEMSKLFGVSLDELTNDGDLNSNNPIKEKNSSKRNTVIIVSLIVVLIVASLIFFGSVFGKQKKVFDLIGKFTNSSSLTKSNFNNQFENYNGTEYDSRVQSLIDDIVTNNKTNDRKVTVEYNDISTMDSNELVDIKRNLDTGKKYEISFEYDDKGFIYKAKIENIEEKTKEEEKNEMSDWDKEYNKHSFNIDFEMYNGTQYGLNVQRLFDKVTTNNQTNEKKVIIKYGETETSEPQELRTLKREFDDKWSEYEVYFEYDEDGYIYEAIIEKL